MAKRNYTNDGTVKYYQLTAFFPHFCTLQLFLCEMPFIGDFYQKNEKSRRGGEGSGGERGEGRRHL